MQYLSLLFTPPSFHAPISLQATTNPITLATHPSLQLCSLGTQLPTQDFWGDYGSHSYPFPLLLSTLSYTATSFQGMSLGAPCFMCTQLYSGSLPVSKHVLSWRDSVHACVTGHSVGAGHRAEGHLGTPAVCISGFTVVYSCCPPLPHDMLQLRKQLTWKKAFL